MTEKGFEFSAKEISLVQIYFISNLMQLRSQYGKVLVHVNLFKVVEKMPSYLDTVILFHCLFVFQTLMQVPLAADPILNP